MPLKNKSLVFAKIPHGVPKQGENLKLEEGSIDDGDLPNGSVFVQVLCLSLDPYMRGRMRAAETKSYTPAFDLGQPLTSFGVGRILKSNNPKYEKGRELYGHFNFSEYQIVSEAHLKTLRDITAYRHGLPVTSFVGAAGMPGKTAAYGFLKIGQPKKGDVVFVSSGAGAVGSLVGQLAKREGCFVMGSAGSEDKVKYMKSIGFDVAINYKKQDLAEELDRLGKPININFENVGGETLDIVLDHMADHGVIVVCGLISGYSSTEQYGYKSIGWVLRKKLRMQGFIISDHTDYEEEFYDTIIPALREGKLIFKEDVTKGIEGAEAAFLGLLEGKNEGKAVVSLAD